MNTSALALEELKTSGKIGNAQAMYLSIYADGVLVQGGPVVLRRALSHFDATLGVKNVFGVEMPARNGRIAELEAMGFLKKHDVVRCPKTKKMVNRWIWTGRTTPLATENVRERCAHCDGKGFVYATRPVAAGQKDFFVENKLNFV